MKYRYQHLSLDRKCVCGNGSGDLEDFRVEECNFIGERQLWKECCYKHVPVAECGFDEVGLMR